MKKILFILVVLVVAGGLFWKFGLKKEAPEPASPPEMTDEMKKMVQDEVARQLAEERQRMKKLPREMPRPVAPLTAPRLPKPAHPLPGSPAVAPPVEEPPAPEPPAEPPAETPGDEPPTPAPGDHSLSVTDLQTATAINREERVPVGMSSSFDMETGEVWAYAVLRNDSTAERKVAFVWKHQGSERGRSELNVGARAARWRTWARKRVTSPGRWVVEVVDESGLTLASRSFDVH